MKKYEYVIFDVDGTLIDPIEGVVKALEKISIINNWEMKNFKELGIVGPPMKKTLMRIYGFDEESAAKYASQFREVYMSETLFDSKVYPGILDTLRTLKESNIKTGIATYKKTDCAEMVVNHYGMSEFIDVVCGDSSNSSRTKAEIMQNCMDLLGVSETNRALMVGDTMEDCKGALQTSIDFCGVTYGYGFSEHDAVTENVKYLINNMEELINIVEEN